MTILKIDSSARSADSHSRILTQYLVERIAGNVIERDLVQDPLPLISGEDLLDLAASATHSRESLRVHTSRSDTLINELMKAEELVFGVAMYNFTIPSSLKQWVDYVCRAGITFKYGEKGPMGLTSIKRAFIVTSSGGVPIGSDMDYASRYLEQICHFIGVEEVIHIKAGGDLGTPEQVIAQAKQQIDKIVALVPDQLALESTMGCV